MVSSLLLIAALIGAPCEANLNACRTRLSTTTNALNESEGRAKALRLGLSQAVQDALTWENRARIERIEREKLQHQLDQVMTSTRTQTCEDDCPSIGFPSWLGWTLSGIAAISTFIAVVR